MRLDLLRGLPREVGVLTAVSFTVALGFGIVAPALPVFARTFGVGETAAAAVISAFAFMRFVSALGGGRLVDRMGERVLLATGIGIVAVSSALAGLAQSYTQLLVLRGIGGLGSALFTVSAFNLLMRVVGPELRGRATGTYQSGFIIGGITGPTLGGVLAAAISIRAPFFVYAGTLAVAGTVAMVFLSRARLGSGPAGERARPARLRDRLRGRRRGRDSATAESRDTRAGARDADRGGDDAETPEQRVTLADALRSSAYRAALTANMGAGWVFFGVRTALVPLFVVEVMGRETLWTGVGFGVVSGVQALTLLVAGRITDTYGRRPAIVGGAVLAAASMVTLALPSSLALYLGSMVLLGAGASFLGVAPGAIVGDVAGGRSGTVVALYQMSRDFGVIVGPLVAGLLAQQTSYGTAFAVSAAIMAATAGLAAASRETRSTAR